MLVSSIKGLRGAGVGMRRLLAASGAKAGACLCLNSRVSRKFPSPRLQLDVAAPLFALACNNRISARRVLSLIVESRKKKNLNGGTLIL